MVTLDRFPRTELQQEQDEFDDAISSNRELETQRKQLAKRLVELREAMGKIREELEAQEKGKESSSCPLADASVPPALQSWSSERAMPKGWPLGKS